MVKYFECLADTKISNLMLHRSAESNAKIASVTKPQNHRIKYVFCLNQQ